MGEQDQPVDRPRILFRRPAESVSKLSHQPGPPRARLARMEDIAPGMHQQLILVRMLFRELEVSTADILNGFSAEQVLVQLRADSNGQRSKDGLLVPKALVNGGSRGTSFARDCAQRQAAFAAHAPQPLGGLQYPFFQ